MKAIALMVGLIAVRQQEVVKNVSGLLIVLMATNVETTFVSGLVFLALAMIINARKASGVPRINVWKDVGMMLIALMANLIAVLQQADVLNVGRLAIVQKDKTVLKINV